MFTLELVVGGLMLIGLLVTLIGAWMEWRARWRQEQRLIVARRAWLASELGWKKKRARRGS